MVEAAERCGRARAGPGAARADERQYRHLARARRAAEGLPAHLRDARERDRGAPAAAAPLRREIVESPGAGGLERRRPASPSSWPRASLASTCSSSTATRRTHAPTIDGTGAEIADALDRVDVLVAGLGTGGTLMGAGARLREAFPDVIVAAAEPLPGDPVMGLRSLEDGYVPPVLDVSKLDRKLLVSNAEAVAGLRALLDREGVFAGVSAGAVVHVARRLAAELDEGVVVAILADAGWKYLSAPFWDAATRRPRWRSPSGGDRGRDPRARSRSTPEPRSRTRPAAWSCCGTAWPSATSRPRTPPRARTASSSRPSPRTGFSRTRATSWRSSTRTSPRRRAPRAPTSRTSASGRAGPYLILSLGTGELAAWRIAGGEVSPIELEAA